MNCEAAVRESMVEKYVLGQLNAAEMERFEEHFFECDRCFLEVRTLRALQEGMRGLPPGVGSGWQRAWWRPAHAWGWAAVAVVVLGAAGASRLWLWQGRTRFSASAEIQAGAAGVAGEAGRAARLRLSELAAFDPPAFTPPLLRGVEPRADREFRAAMAMYREGRYEAAIPGLIAASGADRSHAGSRFFLGICLSMTGKPERASEVFREAAAIGDTPYLESTNFFLAKSHLRLNQPDSARRELEKVIGMRGDLEADARKLLAELQKIVPAGGG